MIKHNVPNHKRCSICGRARGLVIYSNARSTMGTMFAPGIAICPVCDFATDVNGPPIREDSVKDQ